MKKDEVIKNNIKLITNLKKKHNTRTDPKPIPVKLKPSTHVEDDSLMVPQRDCSAVKLATTPNTE